MPNPWMPGLRHDPGRSAGYNAGRNRMFMAVDHDTGGTNSYEICKWGRQGYNAGLCQILLPKIGVPWQFCEIDAICYHAGSSQYGDYNPYGPGYEVERLQGEGLSPDQIHWMGEINRWVASEWGLPNVHYWGPQFPPWGANFNGSVNHRDIHPNPDGLSLEEWNLITQGSEEFTVGNMDDIAQWEKDTRAVILNALVGDAWKGVPAPQGILAGWMQDQSRIVISAVGAAITAAIKTIPTGSGGTVDMAEVEKAVETALAKLHLDLGP